MGSSIVTTRGDNAQTSVVGGIHVSKASPRVDAYGNVDELTGKAGNRFSRAW